MREDQRKPSGFFYGWIVVAACSFCCFSYGMFYALGVFFTPVRQEFGWSYTLTSSIHTLHLLVFIPSTLFIGWLTDKYGPRLPMTLGAVCFGVGFSLLSRTQNLGQFYLFYAVASLGTGIIWVLPMTIVQRWFVKGSGTALGIVTAGLGVGILVYAPLANYFIAHYGWRTAYLQTGVGTALLLFLASFFASTPEQRGALPYGAEQGADKAWVPEVSLGLVEAFKIGTFWLVSMLYFFTVFPVHLIAIHLVPFAELSGIHRATASWAWGLVGAISIFGRIAVPTVVERTIGWRGGIIVVCSVLAATLVWLTGVKSLWMLLVFVVFYGFFYGGKVPLVPALLRSLFGTKSLGQIFGTVHALSLIGGAIGPLFAGYVIDHTGSYRLAFLVTAVMWAMGAFLAWKVKPIKEEVLANRSHSS